MRQNTLSSFTLAVIVMMMTVGIGYNNNAGATPPKENKTVVKTVKKKPKKSNSDVLKSPKYQQMAPMSNTLPGPTALQSKLAVAMAGSGREFVMGGGSGGMGFRGSGGSGGNLGSPTTTKVVKQKPRTKKHPQKKETKPVSPQPLGCSCPVLEAPLNMTLER